MLLFLIFFPRGTSPAVEEEQDTEMPTWKEAVLVLGVSLAFFVVALIGSIVFVYALPSHVRGWANCHTVHTADLHDVETAGDGQFVHTYDVPSDTGQFPFRSELVCEAW
jgi:hypothetical protein